MMSPYSSFSITITAMWAGAPPAMWVTGEAVRCTGARWAPPPPHPAAASAIVASVAATTARNGPGRRISRQR